MSNWRPERLPPLTRAQRRIKRSILAGGIVRFISRDDDDPHAHWIILHPDPNDPIGISYTERLRMSTLRALAWRDLVEEVNWETPLPPEASA